MSVGPRTLLLSLLSACAASPAPREGGGSGDEADGRSLGSGAHTLRHGGRARDYRLHVPTGLPPGAPLLLAFHGYSSNAATLQGYAGLDAIADREGFVVAYPLGTVDDWGNRYFEVGYAFHDGSVDDVGFARALAGELVDALGLDPSAVYATGMSNGGDISYKLACEADDVFSGIAPVAGSMMGQLLDTCSPQRPVPVLEIHGTDDDVTLWDGDPDDVGGWGAYPGTEDMLTFWTDAHGATEYTEEDLPDLAPRDGSTVRARRWSGDGPDARVWLYEVQGGGHDWPGAWGNADIDAAEELWSFLAGAR